MAVAVRWVVRGGRQHMARGRGYLGLREYLALYLFLDFVGSLGHGGETGGRVSERRRFEARAVGKRRFRIS